MPSGSKRSTSLANACSRVPEQVLLYYHSKGHVIGIEQARVLHWVHRSPAEFQPISSHSKHGAKHGARLNITQTWMDSSSVASSWRMWRRPSWDDASF